MDVKDKGIFVARSLYLMMVKFNWTPQEIVKMSLPQYMFIVDGMDWEKKETEKANKKNARR